MDFLKSSSNSECAIMAITMNRNNNIVGFYWDVEKGQIDSKYFLRDLNGNLTTQRDFNCIEKAAVPLRVFQDSMGRLEVSFAMKVSKEKKLYLVSNNCTTEGEPKYSVVFMDPERAQLAQLMEIFVDFSSSSNGLVSTICRCKTIKDGVEFTDCVQVDMGPLAYLL